ncbi:MAG: lysophospholipid acyltransferase family protein [Bacillota bacterium]|nr:lysophospholipid acyltransferase family protein [Bacillota bacterium]
MKVLPILRCGLLLPSMMMECSKGKKKNFVENYFASQAYARKVIKALGYPLQVKGLENLNGLSGVFFVCNHQGTLDPALICASSPLPMHFISKVENESIPVLGQWAQNIETIHFDRETREGNIRMLRETMRFIKRKQNVLIFPEGTRSKGDEMNPFKKNSLKAAVMSKATIVPITINGAYCLDRKDVNIKTLSITYEKPITYEEYQDLSVDALSSKVYAIIESHIEDLEG